MKLELDISDTILQYKKLTEFDVKMMIGIALHNNNIATSSGTAEILGIDRRTFIEEMGRYGGGFDGDEQLLELMKEYNNA
jgi:predicted HTH domain antitoxin